MSNVVSIYKQKPNLALIHWSYVVDALCEDETITPDNIAELWVAIEEFQKLMLEQPEIRNKLKDYL